jgi:enterochelin esterase-like enzyme
VNSPVDPGPGAPRRWPLGAAALLTSVGVLVALLLVTRHLTAQARSTPASPAAALTRPRPVQSASPGYGRFDVTGSGQINPRVQAQVDRQTGGRLTTIHFYSEALHRHADYLMFLPAGYTPTERLPVFYLLHGMPGTPMGFTLNSAIEVHLEQLIRAHRVKPMILVFPDGRIDGREQSDSEWANTPSGDYQSYVVDVIHNVDRRFATLACRQERALAGLSAGAFGAANVGLHEEPLFGLIQVWSGYFTETHNGVFAHADRQVMRYNSPIDYVRTMERTLRQDPLRIFLYVGSSDPYARQLPAMVAALRQEGAHVGSAVYPGGHSWATWAPHVPQMLEMASRDFGQPLGGTAACR